MTQDDREYELALEALRGETRPARDKERVRERLAMRGVAVGAVLGSAPATAAALETSSSVGWGTLTKLVVCAAVATAVGVVASRPDAPRPQGG